MDEIVNKIMQENPELQLPPKPTYGGKYCCVVGCSNNQIRDIARGIKFHTFPKNQTRKQKWINAVKRVDKDNQLWHPGPHDVICSVHFFGGRKSDVEGSPSFIPSIFPTHHTQPKTKVDEDRFKRRQKFQLMREKGIMIQKEKGVVSTSQVEKDALPTISVAHSSTSTSTSTTTSRPSQGESNSLIREEIAMDIQLATLTMDRPESTMEARKKSPFRIFLECGTQTKVDRVKQQPGKENTFVFYMEIISSTEKGTQITSSIGQTDKKRSIHTQTTSQDSSALPIFNFDDRQFRSFCGIDKGVAQFLLLEMGEMLSQGRVLSRESKLSLMLVKLKLNCSFTALSGFFGVSDVLARRVFFHVLEIVYRSVKDYLIWFDKPTIRARMPKSFKALFPETRVIIDCSEIECETPSKLSQKVLMWSNYKSRYTVKFLVGIAPSGEVTFVSKGFGGRATDSQITVASGLLDLIEEGDIVMSDKGFPQIQTAVDKAGGILVMPPFRRGERQFTAKENKDGYECASVRIHVERCIRRLKYFHILKFLSIKMVPHFNKIIVVISFLNNCMNDLIKDEEH